MEGASESLAVRQQQTPRCRAESMYCRRDELCAHVSEFITWKYRSFTAPW